MPETPEFHTSVAIRLKTKAYNEDAAHNRWAVIHRELLRTFGPGGFEITIEPEWEQVFVPDTTEQPEL